MSDVERVYTELCSIREIVRSTSSLSDQSAFEALATMTLLLAAASYFEGAVCDAILNCAKEAGTRTVFTTFIEKQALERRCHMMFNWRASNLNQFLGLFGRQYKEAMERALSHNELAKAVEDFIYINSEQNKLVHENFAAYSLDAVFDEVWNKFGCAKQFTDWLPVKLNEFWQDGS
jgi:hypothetical protein